MSKLSAKQLHILAERTCPGNASLRDIARLCKASEATVRNTLATLTDEKLLRQGRFINYGALGLQSFNLFFSLSKTASKGALTQFAKDPRLKWLAEQAVDPRYELTALVSHPSHMIELLADFGKCSGAALIRRNWSVEVSMTYFGHRYLMSCSSGGASTIDYSSPLDLDLLDVQLIDALQNEVHFESLAALGRFLGLPSSTVSYRITQLEKRGVISPPLYFFGPAYNVTIECQIVLVVADSDPEVPQRLRRFCLETPQVIALIVGFGSWDFKLVVRGWSIEEISSVRDRLEEKFPESFSELLMVPRRKVLLGRPKLSLHPHVRTEFRAPTRSPSKVKESG